MLRALVSPKPLDWLHHPASIYCCFPVQSHLLSGFEAPPDPMPRFQRSRPNSGATLFTSLVKMSVTKPGVPPSGLPAKCITICQFCWSIESVSSPRRCFLHILAFTFMWLRCQIVGCGLARRSS